MTSLTKVLLLFLLLTISPAEALQGKLVCYYDIPGKFDGSEVLKNNYVWGKDLKKPEKDLKLIGDIKEGFFELSTPLLNYADLQQSCHLALKGYPERMLYAIKFSTSSFTISEYPIYIKSDTADKTPIKKIVVFGDSMSDTGNLKNWTRLLSPMPGKNYWHGRASDGPLWIDYMQYLTKIPVLNWSYAGSTTKRIAINILNFFNFTETAEGNDNHETTRDTILRRTTIGSMDLFIEKYLENKEQLNGNILQDRDNTLFILWIGGNDYFIKFLSGNLLTGFLNLDIKEQEKAITLSLLSLEENIRLLITQAHAKYFLIPTMPDLGIPPYIALNDSYTAVNSTKGSAHSRADLSLKLSLLTKRHNQKLKEMLEKLRLESAIKKQNVEIILQDIANDLEHVLDNKNFDYQFTPLLSSFFIENKQTKFYFDKPCIGPGKSGINPACLNSPNRTRFWDDTHLTSYSHCFLENIFQNTLAQKGLLPKAKSLVEQRQYCQSKQWF